MADNRLHINTGLDLTGVPGARPILGPWPSLGGSLFAAYMFGSAYPQWSDILGATVGTDWSGNGRHLTIFGEAEPNIAEYGLACAVMNDEPTLPFTPNDLLAANGEFSIVALAYCPATAKTVALARNGTVEPTSSLTIAPQSADCRVTVTQSGAVTASISDLTTELNNIALYGGTFKTNIRWAFSKQGSADTKTASESTAKSLAASTPFEIADEASTGTGVSYIYGLGFYDLAILESEFDSILVRQRVWHEAIGAGLPI